MACCGCFGKSKPEDETDKSPEPDKTSDDKDKEQTVKPVNGTVNTAELEVVAVAVPKQQLEPQKQQLEPQKQQSEPQKETELKQQAAPQVKTKKVDIEAARKEFFEDMYSPGSCPVNEKHVCFGRHEEQEQFCDLPMCFKKLEEHKLLLEKLQLKEKAEGLTQEEQEEVDRMTAELKSLVDRLESVALRLEKAAPVPCALTGPAFTPVPAPMTSSPTAVSYGNLVTGPVQKFCDLSKKIQGDIANLSDLVLELYRAQQEFIAMASRSKQPSQQKLMEILKPQSELILKIQEFREKNRRSSQFNHLSAISESIPALGWVTVAPAPAPYVKEMSDAGQFYTNRVLKEWKEKDKSHVEWVRAWLECLTELQAYIKQYHTTGLVWNPAGGEAALSSGSLSVGGVPPPPPPGPPPPPPPMMPPPTQIDSNLDRSALFAEINQGADITKGLKKVTSDMQTHKNPTLRAGPAPFKPSPGPKPYQPPTQTASSVKPPVFQLDGKKWLVEYQKDAPALMISDTSMNQSVYMYRCENTTLQVKGKINSVIMDSCKKSAVVFDSLVASMEFVNCQSVQMQVMGSVPTINVDKCDGVQMYLSEDSLGVELVTAKSSEMNVIMPSQDGDFIEQPVPEQFKTTIAGRKLNTVCTESL